MYQIIFYQIDNCENLKYQSKIKKMELVNKNEMKWVGLIYYVIVIKSSLIMFFFVWGSNLAYIMHCSYHLS